MHRLLVESNQTVSQIADRLGYASVHLLCRQFRAAYQCTPTRYRRGM